MPYNTVRKGCGNQRLPQLVHGHLLIVLSVGVVIASLRKPQRSLLASDNQKTLDFRPAHTMLGWLRCRCRRLRML